jgi:iron(III) transport system substrate-binding protein
VTALTFFDCKQLGRCLPHCCLQNFALRVRLYLLYALCLIFQGCSSEPKSEVVVYTALDREFSEPLLEEYRTSTGTTVLAKYDVESTKTVGLTEALIAEKGRPRCDLFWNNEILNTIRLQKLGLLTAVKSPHGEEFPAAMRDPAGAWYGFAARLRILIVNTKLLQESEYPQSILELRDPKWRGRAGMAKPLFGTTATHMAVLFSTWGDEQATEFLRAVVANQTKILGGNKQVATAVASGQLAWGLTDTDDALGQIEAGMPVAIVYPDQEKYGLGVLAIPNTLAILHGCPHPEQATALREYLLTPSIENALANGPSGQVPLHPQARASKRLKPWSELRLQAVDWNMAAEAWPAVMQAIRAAIVE